MYNLFIFGEMWFKIIEPMAYRLKALKQGCDNNNGIEVSGTFFSYCLDISCFIPMLFRDRPDNFITTPHAFRKQILLLTLIF